MFENNIKLVKRILKYNKLLNTNCLFCVIRAIFFVKSMSQAIFTRLHICTSEEEEACSATSRPLLAALLSCFHFFYQDRHCNPPRVKSPLKEERRRRLIDTHGWMDTQMHQV